MTYKRGFLILNRGDGSVAVYRPSTFPRGTIIDRDARRFEFLAEGRYDPPAEILTEAELEQWRVTLEEAGIEVKIGPFWTSGIDPSKLDMEELRKDSVPLKEAFDELLRQAEARDEAKARRSEPVVSPHE